MDKKEFFGKLEEVVGRPAGSIADADRLGDLEGWDSIAALSVIALLDRHYGVALEVGALANSPTAGDLFQFVAKGSR